MEYQREDSDSIQVDLAAGETLSTNHTRPEVRTVHSENVFTFIDDGSTGGSPASYDMVQERYSQELGDWVEYDSVSGKTAQSYRDPSCPHRFRLDITNASSSTATYRIELVSVRG